VNPDPAVPVSNTMILLAPGVEPASITYDVGESPDVGPSHPRLTVVPFTNDIRFPGEPGAVAAAGFDVSWPVRAGQPTPSVIQLQVTVRLAALPNPVAVGVPGNDVDGRVGAGPSLQPHVRRDVTANPTATMCLISSTP